MDTFKKTYTYNMDKHFLLEESNSRYWVRKEQLQRRAEWSISRREQFKSKKNIWYSNLIHTVFWYGQ